MTRWLLLVCGLAACGGDGPPRPTFTAVTLNTGTNPELPHDGPPDDGYGAEQAAYSDQYYGDGLAWVPVIDATRAFFDEAGADVVAFQEIFSSEDCPLVPAEARPGFVCETWQPGDPTVAQLVVGPDYQVACHVGHHDKCLAVRRGFGAIRGCDGDLCLDGAAGTEIPDCGGGARVGRIVIDRVEGAPITVVNVHGTSGFAPADIACRTAQVEQVFLDLGDGAPGANGDHDLILGDLNTDPGRLAGDDASAARWNDFAGEDAGGDFHFVTEVGPDAPPSYADLLNIDHVITDTMPGSCWIGGVSDGHPPITDAVFFDHRPVVCAVELPD
jgi:hypothetical protein